MISIDFLDLTSLLLQLKLCVRHHDMVENFALVELVREVFRKLNITNSITIHAEAQFLFKPSEGVWLPFQVDVQVVDAWSQVGFQVCVTVLASYVFGNKMTGN